MKRSPFFNEITQHSPSLVGVQGWEVPNLFTTVANEHRAVRKRVGLMDWSTTGELGYELLVPAEHAHDVWQALMAAGEEYGLGLCGLAAAFGLRIEKGYVMRFDFAGGRTPYEAGLGWTVKLDKGDFVGREALIRRREAGLSETLASLALQDSHVPVTGEAIVSDGEPVGAVTSAAFGYTVGTPLALGYLPLCLARLGTRVEVRETSGGLHPALVGPRSPYDPRGARLRG